MKRWDGYDLNDYPHVDAFIEEIVAVCEKHGLSIAHEDFHGGFIIEENNASNYDWLRAASYPQPKKESPHD